MKNTHENRVPWMRFEPLDVLIFVVLALVLVFTSYPFFNSVILSFNDGQDAAAGGIYFWPRQFTLTNYEDVFANASLGRAFIVTVIRTIVGTAVCLLVTSLFAFAVSKPYLRLRKLYIGLSLVAMYLNGGLIPTFLTVRNLGLYNNPLVYVIPWAFNVFYAQVFIAFFRGMPETLDESAKIDGANEWVIFFRIIAPLSMASFAAVGLFVAVNHWNAWYDNMLYIKNERYNTLSYLFVQMINSQKALESMMQAGTGGSMEMARAAGKTTTSVQLATMVVTVAPIMCLYPFLQKYFVKGVMVGSIKG